VSRTPTRAKIVATLGPASARLATIRALARAGADVFRLNFSHGDHPSHARLIALVRRVEALEYRPLAILADLQGPKIRVGRLRGGQPLILRRGQPLSIVARPGAIGEPGRIGCTYAGLARDVRRGSRILLDDGNLEVEVVRVRGDEVQTRVRAGGILREHRGINLPGAPVGAPSLGRKDLADLAFVLDQGVDFIGLSFVRSAGEVRDLSRRIAKAGSAAQVIAKIERPEAVDRIDEIVEAADGILIARGDMGVELGAEEVPGIQKRLIRLAVAAAKPVITATQMLESMIEHPRPTRAEASDVANAVLDGTSAVMLSAETASGAYPVEAVRTMERIVRRTERDIGLPSRETGEPHDAVARRLASRRGSPPSIAESITCAAAGAAVEARARVVAVLTEHGRTAHLLARERIPTPVVAFTPSRATWRQLALEWGVTPSRLEHAGSAAALQRAVARALLGHRWAAKGDRVVFVAGRLRVSGATDSVHLRSLAAKFPTSMP